MIGRSAVGVLVLTAGMLGCAGIERKASMSEPTTTLETVIIYSTDIESLARFYTDGLGLGPFVAAPKHLGCRVGATYFGLDQVEAPPGSYPGAVSAWFTVPDLQETFDRCVSLGARVRFEPTEKPWGAKLAAVYDPDCNIVGLSQAGR